jgi:hypothetical protein
MSRPKKFRPQIQEKIVERAPEATVESVKDNLISNEEVKVVEPIQKPVKIITSPDASITNIPLSQKELSRQKLNKLIEEEYRLVKGRFRHHETPGGLLRVQIRKYPSIPSFDKVLVDGQVYEIPLYVARHLNGIDKSCPGGGAESHTCSYPVHEFLWAGDGRGPAPSNKLDDNGVPMPAQTTQKWIRRFSFESMEFDLNK